MNPEQFGKFVEAKQVNSAAARQAVQQYEQRIVAQQDTSSQQQAEAQAKRVPACDGSTTKAVRERIREVEFTIPYSTTTVYI